MDLSKIKLKSGWSMDRERFGPRALAIFDRAIDDCRARVVLPMDAIMGSRFRDDWTILVRVESMFTETEFVECPGPRIDAALVDAARADWWYAHEKRYDDEQTETEIDSDDE